MHRCGVDVTANAIRCVVDSHVDHGGAGLDGVGGDHVDGSGREVRFAVRVWHTATVASRSISNAAIGLPTSGDRPTVSPASVVTGIATMAHVARAEPLAKNHFPLTR